MSCQKCLEIMLCNQIWPLIIKTAHQFCCWTTWKNKKKGGGTFWVPPSLSLSLLINWTACFFIFPSSLSSPSPLAPPLSFFISRIVTWRWKREWIDEIDWLIAAAAAARCCRRRCRSNHPLSVCAPFLYRPTKVPKPSHMTTYFARVRDVHH